MNLCFDRRRGGRVRGGPDVAVVDTSAARVVHGVVLDESVSGCRVALCRVMPVKKGTLLECHAVPAPGRPIPRRMARVVWTRKSKDRAGNPVTHAGLEYVVGSALRLAA